MPDNSISGGRKPRVSDEELLDVFRSTSDPVLSTAEVAAAVPIQRRGTLSRLQKLADAGRLARKEIGGRNTVWWLTVERAESGTESERTPAPGDTPTDTPDVETPPARTASDVVDSGEPGALADVEFPGGRDRDECVAAVHAARDHIRDHGEATKQELVENVIPEHPLGYDVDAALGKTDTDGERFRGAWWRKVVRPGLKALDDVQTPPQGASTWRYTGEALADT